jgi:hypothetical protein
MIKAIYEYFIASLIVFAFLSLFTFRGFPPIESSSLPSGGFDQIQWCHP